VVILGEGLWQSRYGRDAAIVGRTVLVDGAPRIVVGIAPRDVGFASNVDVWPPLAPNPAEENRGNHVVTVIGRLKPGMNIARASSELNSVTESLEREHPTRTRGGEFAWRG